MSTKALTPSLKSLIANEKVEARFQKMLGNRASSFLSSMVTAVNNSEKLKGADPMSVLSAAAAAASLNLPINPNLGFAYLVPYSVKQADGTYKKLCQFQVGYKGFIQLALRTNQFTTINKSDVREGELVSVNRLTGEMVFEWNQTEDRESLPVIGYISYFALQNGFSKQFYMTVKDLRAHGSQYSKTYASKKGRWKLDFEGMASKTVLKLLLSKYAPLSPDMQRAVTIDQAVMEDLDGNKWSYVDNQDTPAPIDVTKQHEKATFDRVAKFVSTAKTLEDLELLRPIVEVSQNQEVIQYLDQKIEEYQEKNGK